MRWKLVGPSIPTENPEVLIFTLLAGIYLLRIFCIFAKYDMKEREHREPGGDIQQSDWAADAGGGQSSPR